MIKKLIPCLYAVYLGMALSLFANTHFYNWQFYAILVPVTVLVNWSRLEEQR